MEMLLTIVSGTTVYVLGQFTLKMIIEPLQDIKKEIQKVLSNCIYFAGIVTNMPHVKEEYIKEASSVIRKSSTELKSKYAILPFKGLFAMLRVLPNEHNMSEASSRLIGISNLSVTDGQFENNIKNNEWLKEVEILLNPKSGEN